MAHHQHHGHRLDAEMAASAMHSRPSASATMPSISEDEHVAEGDEPPDMAHHQEQKQMFTKTACRPAQAVRRQSLLSKAFHTDSESQDHDHDTLPRSILQQPISRTSTCSTTYSTQSYRDNSAGNWTSDDALHSPSTRASTPTSPRTAATLGGRKLPPQIGFRLTKPDDTVTKNSANKEETSIEQELGRKRCISFFCSSSKPKVAPSTQSDLKPESQLEAAPAPSTKHCSIKFVCPSRLFSPGDASKDGHFRATRHHSPAPPAMAASPSPSPSSKSVRRSHRGSDSTVKLDSPKTSFRNLPGLRRLSTISQPPRTEATRFHEFAGSDEEIEDWLQQSTCHRSRLTVEDTLKKENDIRKLTEEAEEEALEEEDDLDEDDDDENEDVDPFSDYDLEDDGFQSDVEAGFASSDEESDGDSDYEWWAPRRSSVAASPFLPHQGQNPRRPSTARSLSDISEDAASPIEPHIRPTTSRRSAPVNIRSHSPELPDSTDFVCGTLDEDRPVEEAFLANMRQRKAAKQSRPQDIDPSFPTSDPEMMNDDFDEEDEVSEEEKKTPRKHKTSTRESDHHQRSVFMRDFEAEEPRGRKQSNGMPKPCTSPSPRRGRSPAPATVRRCARSPPPRGMFHTSPKRLRSPPPPARLPSPPPSRETSKTTSPAGQTAFTHTFLGESSHEPTHTSSLPRSPAPFTRHRGSNYLGSEDEDDDETEHERPYTRGAIDIVQGLERKRLKRREKLYKQYWKREEKKKGKRPQPGKGAERMRKATCGDYKSKRMLSI